MSDNLGEEVQDHIVSEADLRCVRCGSKLEDIEREYAPPCGAPTVHTPKYEWFVMHSRFPDEPHRGPWSESEVREWIQEGIEDGFKPGYFLVGRRQVGPIEIVD